MARVEATQLDVSAPRAEARSQRQAGQEKPAAGRTVHTARSAASAWAAHVLFEAGEAGQDPADVVRASRAYGQTQATAQRLRATA